MKTWSRAFLALWLLGCAWMAPASAEDPAYVLVVDASGSMASTRREDLFDAGREPGQTLWEFMREAIRQLD